MVGWLFTIAVIGLIIGFSRLIDWLLSKVENRAAKDSVVKWWVELGTFSYHDAIRKSNANINKLFDTIYGKRFFSQQCAFMSLVSSITAIVSVKAFSIVVLGSRLPSFNTGNVFGFLLLFAILNLWVDFISLLETRFLLRQSRKGKLLLLLVIDLVVSSLIFQAGLCVLIVLQQLFFETAADDPIFLTWSDYCNILNPFIFVRIFGTDVDDVTFVCYFSTFFTSVFFYLYCMSTLFFKTLSLHKTRLMNLLENLESKDRLFTAMGTFFAVIVLIIKSVITILDLLP